MELTTVFLFVVLLFFHFGLGILARGYDLYGEFFALLVHLVGGMFLYSFTGSILLSFTLAALWEMFEYLFDKYTRLGDVVYWRCRGWFQAYWGFLWSIIGSLILCLT